MGETLLRKWLLGDFGLEVVELTPVAYGADIAAQVWKAGTATNTYAVKWSAAGTNTGHQVAAFLADSGLPGVPEMIRTTEGGLWSVHAKKRLTITPWIDGVRAAQSGLTDGQWSEYGALIRRVHDSEPPHRLRDALPKHSHIDARMPAIAAEVGKRLETPEGEVEEELAAVWKQFEHVITDLRTNRPPQPDGPRVICHGDPHLGNVLVDTSGDTSGDTRLDTRLDASVHTSLDTTVDTSGDTTLDASVHTGGETRLDASVHTGGATRLGARSNTIGETRLGVSGGGLHLIDWDDVIYAPREQDLMFMLGGMGDVGPTTRSQLDAFLDGYGPHEIDQDAIHYYRHVRAFEDVIGWSHQAITGPDESYALKVTKGILTKGLAALAVP